MKNYLTILTVACTAFLCACGTTEERQDTEEVQALDSIEQTLDANIEAIEEETADMTHDVDSLLEGI